MKAALSFIHIYSFERSGQNTFSRNEIFRLALNFQYIGNQSEQMIL